MNIIKESNSLNPNQARNFVVPDLDPKCLQRLTADETSRQRVNTKLVDKHKERGEWGWGSDQGRDQ